MMVDAARSWPSTGHSAAVYPAGTQGTFSFMTAWSEFMMARVMLQKAGMFTWPRAFRTYGPVST